MNTLKDPPTEMEKSNNLSHVADTFVWPRVSVMTKELYEGQ